MNTQTAIRESALRHGGLVKIGRGDKPILEDLRAAGASDQAVNLRSTLSEMARKGEAIRLERGSYAIPDAHGTVQPLAIGPRLAKGGYVSLLTAADHYGLTMSQTRTVSVIGPKDRAPLDAPEIDAKFVFHMVAPKRIFGWREEQMGSVYAPIATIERMLIDLVWLDGAADDPDPGEIVRIWKEAGEQGVVNAASLARLVAQMDSAWLVRRVGYLMDLAGIEGSDRLLPSIGGDPNYIPLFRSNPDLPMQRAGRWRIKGA